VAGCTRMSESYVCILELQLDERTKLGRNREASGQPLRGVRFEILAARVRERSIAKHLGNGCRSQSYLTSTFTYGRTRGALGVLCKIS
jgi:hypothetical protein